MFLLWSFCNQSTYLPTHLPTYLPTYLPSLQIMNRDGHETKTILLNEACTADLQIPGRAFILIILIIFIFIFIFSIL